MQLLTGLDPIAMNRGACFLILLLFSAQADGTWDLSPVSASQGVDDDDEYLPLKREQELLHALRGGASLLADLFPRASDFFLSCPESGVATAPNHFGPFRILPLDLLMSFQC